MQFGIQHHDRGSSTTPSSAARSHEEVGALAQLKSELAICLKELAFSRFELEDTNDRARHAEQEQHDEAVALRAELERLTHKATSARTRNREACLAEQRELELRSQELQDMWAEVQMAEAESDFASVVHGPGREEWRHVEALTEQTRHVEEACAGLREEHGGLEYEVASMKTNLQRQLAQHEQQRQEVQELETALVGRERSVDVYEARARDLHQELRQVLEQLRASYEGAREEKERLAAHVASLENEPSRDMVHDHARDFTDGVDLGIDDDSLPSGQGSPVSYSFDAQMSGQCGHPAGSPGSPLAPGSRGHGSRQRRRTPPPFGSPPSLCSSPEGASLATAPALRRPAWARPSPSANHRHHPK